MKRFLVALLLALAATASAQITPGGGGGGGGGSGSSLSNSTTVSKTGTSILAAQFPTLEQITLSGAPGATTNNANSFANYWKLTDSMDDTGVGSNLGVAGGLELDYVMTSSTKAGRTPLVVRLDSTANTADSGVTDRNYVGITSFVNTHSEGGTANSVGNTFGQWYGLNTNVVIPSGATFNTVAMDQENDIANLSTTLDNKIGVLVVTTSTDAHQAVHGDYAFDTAGQTTIASGAPGWKCGMCFGAYSGFFNIAATGTIFSDWANSNASGMGLNVATVGSIMDFNALTVTNFDLNLPGLQVDGKGDISFAGLGALSAASWTTLGAQFNSGINTRTYTDTTASGTVANETLASFNGGNVAATNAATTITNLSTLYVAVPGTGTNVTATNKYSVNMAGGFLANGTSLLQGAFTQNSGNLILGDASHSFILQGNSSSTFKMNNQLLLNGAAPTVSSGFGTTPSIVANSGAASFSVNVGTGGAASSGVIALGTASHGWACSAADVTTPASNMTQQSASSTTTATFTNYVRTTGVAGAWPASDVLEVSCLAN